MTGGVVQILNQVLDERDRTGIVKKPIHNQQVTKGIRTVCMTA